MVNFRSVRSTARPWLRRRLPGGDPEAGQVLIITVLGMFVILAIAAFVIDVAQLDLARHRAQLAADAGSLAAARAMENQGASPASVTTAGTTIATDNDGGGTVTITQPEGSSGAQAAATVKQSVSLPFGSVFGFPTGSVSATSVAQVESKETQVADGNISAAGCNNGADSFCEYYINCVPASQGGCPSPSPVGIESVWIGTQGYWRVTNVAEDPDTSFNNGYSSVDLQDCGGAVNGTCTGDSGVTNTTEVVDLNGATEGGMYETVSTVTGAKYVLTFLLTANPAGDQQSGWQSHDTFTGDVQITNGSSQYTPSCTGSNDAQASCECPASRTGVIASLCFTHSNPIVNGTEVASFQEETLPFTATSSSTTITFNSSTYGGNAQPWMFFGPEVTNVDLNYPDDALVQ